MSEKLLCPVCGKEYVSKYHYDRHVESHGEHEVTWNEEGEPVVEEIEVPEIEVVADEEEPEEIVYEYDPEMAKNLAVSALGKLNTIAEIMGMPTESFANRWNDALGDIVIAIEHLTD